MLHPRLQKRVDDSVRKIAQRHGIRLYRYANVGNHLHLLVQAPTRKAFQYFLKDLTGSIAILITGAKNGQKLEARFWDFPAYTRIVSWGRDFNNLKLYFIQNLFEAQGWLTKKMKEAGIRPIPLNGWAEGPKLNKRG